MESKRSCNWRSEREEEDYRCVQCASPIQTLYVQYSPGNIRLIKCSNCKAVADEYIECERMILIIDLILHKSKPYRHLFFNKFSTQIFNQGLLWKLALVFLALDTYRVMVLTTSEKERNSPGTFGSSAWTFWKVLMDVFLANFVFLCALLTCTKRFLKTKTGLLGYKDIILAILVSSYFKAFLISMMVWEFPSSVVFIVDMFVLSSNTVALQVITDSSIVRCSGVSLFANSLKFIVGCKLGNLLPWLLV